RSRLQDDATSHSSRLCPRSLADLDGLVEKDLEPGAGGHRHRPRWLAGAARMRARERAVDGPARDADTDGLRDEGARGRRGDMAEDRAAVVVSLGRAILDTNPEAPIRVLGLRIHARLAPVGKEGGVEPDGHATRGRAR